MFVNGWQKGEGLMSKSVEQLILTLNKEEEIYRDILEVSKKKRKAIREQQIAELEALTNYEQGLVVTLFKLEEIREKVVDLVMREHHLDFVDNVTQLAQYLETEDRVQVIDAKNSLLVMVKNVSDENKFNGKLIEERLNLINMNIDLLTQISDDGGKYNNRAISDENERRSIFDRKV